MIYKASHITNFRFDISNLIGYNFHCSTEGERKLITYDPLWKKIVDLKLSKTQMAEKAGISKNTLAKMGKNEYVALEIIERICMKLEIAIEDVVEVKADDPAGN